MAKEIINLALRSILVHTWNGSLICCKIFDIELTVVLPLRRKACCGFSSHLKIHRLRPYLNPWTSDGKHANHYTTEDFTEAQCVHHYLPDYTTQHSRRQQLHTRSCENLWSRHVIYLPFWHSLAGFPSQRRPIPLLEDSRSTALRTVVVWVVTQCRLVHCFQRFGWICWLARVIEGIKCGVTRRDRVNSNHSYSVSLRFKYSSSDRLSWVRFSWFSSVHPRKSQDSTLNCATCTYFFRFINCPIIQLR
jgi:hypothetical protein